MTIKGVKEGVADRRKVLALLRQGVKGFNSWRVENPQVKINLWEADLREANLSGVKLWGADLFGADLSKANLSGAYLSGADLYGANLSGADLRRADLSGADLRVANLWGVTGISQDVLEKYLAELKNSIRL